MTDLFSRMNAAPAQPPAAQDKDQGESPRSDGQRACAICGAPAYFGFGVKLLAGRPGRWSCQAHREAVKNGTAQ